MAHIRNWRDQQPEVAHLSAIRWPGLKNKNATPKRADEDAHRLHHLQGMVKHALQGRKTSDHHKHAQVEQAYYILSGNGEVLVGEDRFPVRPGDAVYLPADIHHQMFNDMNDDWLEHLVLGKNIDAAPGGACVIRNWEDVLPVSDGKGAIRWHQLGPVAEENGCLKSIVFIDREAVICFPQMGRVIFLDARTMPRAITSLPATIRDGMTCVWLNSPGSLVLLPN